MLVSVCSNVPVYETAECFVFNKDPATMIHVSKLSFGNQYEAIPMYAAKISQFWINWRSKFKNILLIGAKLTHHSRLHEQLTKIMKQLPVVGFYSGRYDQSAMKTEISHSS